MTPPRSLSIATSAAWAFLLATVLTPMLGVLAMGLAFIFAHATTPAQVVVLRIVFGAAVFMDTASDMPFLLGYCIYQFPLIWLLAFLGIKGYSVLRVRGAHRSRLTAQ